VTFFLFDKNTLATLRKAELGFFGVATKTLRQKPFFCGFLSNAFLLFFLIFFFQPLFINCWIVGIHISY
jgi:hypothetical protein